MKPEHTYPEQIWLQRNDPDGTYQNSTEITWCADNINKADIKYIRADLARQWISVKDRMPEYTTRASGTAFCFVLAYVKNWGVEYCMYCNGRFHKSLMLDMHKSFNQSVTHWMPLPNKPEADK